MKKFVLILLFANACYCPLISQVIDHPTTSWKFQTNGPIRGGILAQDNALFFGSADGHLYSIEKISGKLLWKYKTQGAIVSSPAISGSTIVVSSRDNVAYALNVTTGQLIWKYQMQAPVKFDWEWDYTMASPVIDGKNVLIGSGDSHIYSLTLDKGKMLWKYKTNGRVRSTTLVVNQAVYQASLDGYVYVLNSKNGEFQWKFETKGATLDGKLYGFDRTSIYSSPKLADSLLIFGSRDGSTYCVNINTRKVKWKFFYDGTWAMSAPALENGIAYMGWSTNFRFNAIDVTTGKEKWSFKSNGVHYADPVIRGKVIYTACGDGNLYCLDKETGKEVWRHKTSASVYSTPWVDSEGIYVGSDDGSLYHIREQEKAMMAVYSPVPRNASFRSAYEVESKVAPYLVSKGFEHLDSGKLHRFLTNRLMDKKPSVVVFPYQDVPDNIYGADPSKGLLRQYLEAGGKVVWFGGLPKKYLLDDKGQFYKEDTSIGLKLLGLTADFPMESGAYYSTSTQEGLNWGLPEWHSSAYGILSSNANITSLSNNENGQSSIWVKSFSNKPGTGFVSCRTWPWHVPFPEEQLPLIYKIAVYGLE